VRVHTHANGAYELSFVHRGTLEFEVGARVLSAPAGHAVLLPPEVVNTPRLVSAGFCQVWLPPTLVDEAGDALGGRARAPRDPVVLGPGHRVPGILQAIAREAPYGLEDPGVAALVDALAFAVVRADDAGARSGVDRRIQRALERVHDDFAAPLGVADLARAAGMTRSVFLRCFRAQVGESPYQYLQQVRLDQAARRLAASEASVLEVALDCGFADPGRFARAFRARFGCTPRAYRQRAR
jgi:AraC family transcriptional regulator